MQQQSSAHLLSTEFLLQTSNTAAHTKHVRHVRHIVQRSTAGAAHTPTHTIARLSCTGVLSNSGVVVARGVLSNRFEASHTHTRTDTPHTGNPVWAHTVVGGGMALPRRDAAHTGVCVRRNSRSTQHAQAHRERERHRVREQAVEDWELSRSGGTYTHTILACVHGPRTVV